MRPQLVCSAASTAMISRQGWLQLLREMCRALPWLSRLLHVVQAASKGCTVKGHARCHMPGNIQCQMPHVFLRPKHVGTVVGNRDRVAQCIELNKSNRLPMPTHPSRHWGSIHALLRRRDLTNDLVQEAHPLPIWHGHPAGHVCLHPLPAVGEVMMLLLAPEDSGAHPLAIAKNTGWSCMLLHHQPGHAASSAWLASDILFREPGQDPEVQQAHLRLCTGHARRIR